METGTDSMFLYSTSDGDFLTLALSFAKSNRTSRDTWRVRVTHGKIVRTYQCRFSTLCSAIIGACSTLCPLWAWNVVTWIEVVFVIYLDTDGFDVVCRWLYCLMIQPTCIFAYAKWQNSMSFRPSVEIRSFQMRNWTPHLIDYQRNQDRLMASWSSISP